MPKVEIPPLRRSAKFARHGSIFPVTAGPATVTTGPSTVAAGPSIQIPGPSSVGPLLPGLPTTHQPSSTSLTEHVIPEGAPGPSSLFPIESLTAQGFSMNLYLLLNRNS
jgi:hypothetical protein